MTISGKSEPSTAVTRQPWTVGTARRGCLKRDQNMQPGQAVLSERAVCPNAGSGAHGVRALPFLCATF